MIVKFIEGAIEGFILVNKARKYRKILVSRYNSIYYKKPIKVKKVKPIKSGRNIPYSKNPPMPKKAFIPISDNDLDQHTKEMLNDLGIKYDILNKSFYDESRIILSIDSFSETIYISDYYNYYRNVKPKIFEIAKKLKNRYDKSTVSDYKLYYKCDWLSPDFKLWYTKNMSYIYRLESGLSNDNVYFRIKLLSDVYDGCDILYERYFPKPHFKHFRNKNEEIIITELKEQFKLP